MFDWTDFDWNTVKVPNWRGARPIQVVDETLRDGLQNATAIDPPIEAKRRMLELMEAVGVDVVSVGLPAASSRALDQAAEMAAFIRNRGLSLQPTAAARTVARDVLGVAEVQQRTGVKVEVYAFIGSSPIRHFTENWDTAFLLKHIREATETAQSEGVPFCLVTEDTTRARPEMLEELFKCALDGGAERLCLCDTVGYATPDGVARLVRWTKDLLVANGHAERVGLDWHAHNDRGLALQTALWASEVGVDRVHGTALGIGERVGNVPLELLMLNLGLLGSKPASDHEQLRAYCDEAVSALGLGHMPDTHPLYGRAAQQREAEGLPRTASQAPSKAPAESEPAPPPTNPLVPLTMTINGDRVDLAVAPNRTLLEVLRYDLDLYGTKQGCDKGDCGACTVRLDGQPHLSCLSLALACEGRSVQTIEDMPGGGDLHPLLDAFDRTGATQCGFCTPGFLMTAWALLEEEPSPTRAQIIEAISSNLCRCTGYKAIIDAIEMAAAMKRGEVPRMDGIPGRDNLPGPIDDPKIGR
jgi:2-isopropylmalate synthase